MLLKCKKLSCKAQSRRCYSVLYTSTPPNIEKLQESRRQKDRNLYMPDCTGTYFTNTIYTKLSTFPSSKKMILCGHSFSLLKIKSGL
jgi:hypothetical protein